MHKSVLTFLKAHLSRIEVEGKRILEVGSRDFNGSPRPIVTALGPKDYLGVDGQLGVGVDVGCSATNLERVFGVESFDILISTEMLEHVEDWRPVVSQLKRVVKEGGLLLITTRSPGFPYHPFPIDVWRYTKDDFRSVFSDMEILALEDDPQVPGVFLKARKPSGFTEKKLAGVEVHRLKQPKR